MADVINVRELRDFLNMVVEMGYGHATVYFDTEARRFDYHMAKVARAYFETAEDTGLEVDMVTLHEKHR